MEPVLNEEQFNHIKTFFKNQTISPFLQSVLDKPFKSLTVGDQCHVRWEYEIGFGQISLNIPTISIEPTNIVDLIHQLDESRSKSQIRALLKQGGVKINGEVIHDHQVIVTSNITLQIGKKITVKICTT